MKNKTFVRISAFLVALVMSLSLFAVYASADEKVFYDEDNCTMSYEDGTITATIDAEKLGNVLEKGKFTKGALEDLLPSGVYRIIDERSKASVIAFLVNLVQKDVLTYDELLKAFSGNETVMNRYVNYDFYAPYVATTPELTRDAMRNLYADGKLDAILAIDEFRTALLEKAGTKDIAEAVTHYKEFSELIQDMGLQDKISSRDLWEYMDVENGIANAPGSKINKSLRSFLNQVIAGEIDEAYVNGTKVFYTTERGKELDHNELQTALLQGLPSVEEVANMKAGDTLVDYKIETKGLENESGEERVDMHFGLKIVLKGDTTKLNNYAARFVNFLDFFVSDDGLITVNVYWDGRFAENYTKVLDCEEISKDRKYEYLGLYDEGAEEMRKQLTGAKFEEFLADAEAAAVKGSGRIEEQKEQILKIRNLLLKYSQYETVFTNIDDTYLGDGCFCIRLTDVIPMSTIEEKVQSRFSSAEELFKWLSEDDHIIDTEYNIQIDDFYRLRYFDSELNQLYVTYIPVGTDLSFFDDCAEIQGYAEFGWTDLFGDTYTEMPDHDLDLIETVPTTDIVIQKVWDDNDNEAGMRPESVTLTLNMNGEKVLTFKVGEEGVIVDDELIEQLMEMLRQVFGDFEDIEPIDGEFEEDPTFGDDDIDDLDDPDDPDEPIGEIIPWGVAFPGMPAYLNGEPVVYEVVEEPVSHYTSQVTEENGVFVVTNTYVSEVKDITVTKVWDDDSNNDGVRPASISVTLKANGEECATAVVYGVPVEAGDSEEDLIESNAQLAEVSEDGNTWTFVFAGVPTYANGEEIAYTVEEAEVDGYATTIDGFTITNTRATELVTVTGLKVWDDEDNRRNKRPESVTIVLYADGEEVARQDVTGEGNEWNFEFGRLAKYKDGEEIEYTIDEIEVEKYAKTIDGTTITNTYVKSPDTGAAEISLFVILGVLALAGSAAAVITYKKRRDQK